MDGQNDLKWIFRESVRQSKSHQNRSHFSKNTEFISIYEKYFKDSFLFGNGEKVLVWLGDDHSMKHVSNIFQFRLLQYHPNEYNLECFQFHDAKLPLHDPKWHIIISSTLIDFDS